MIYKVVDTLTVGNDTSVTIEGDGKGLKNNMTVYDDNGNSHILKSTAIVCGLNSFMNESTVLVQGAFKSSEIRF